MAFNKSFTIDAARNVGIFRLEMDMYNLVDEYIRGSLREEIKNFVQSDEVKGKVYREIEKYLEGAETKEVLTRMIAEVVSETIKTTILELKQQGVI